VQSQVVPERSFGSGELDEYPVSPKPGLDFLGFSVSAICESEYWMFA
jgi:hypothetical protein